MRSIEDIPFQFRDVFTKFKMFNKMQSKVFDDVLHSDKSLVLSAPTGSGKTVIFELSIIQLLMNCEPHGNVDEVKIIYIAPIKALCSELYSDWTEKFRPLNIKCCEVTGDTTEINELKDLLEYQLILTTPEKWDSLTRTWKDSDKILNRINLLFLDEVHMVNEDKRGPILEAIVTRMKTINLDNHMRVIAVSATIPNIENFAQWLSKSTDDIKMFDMADYMRPVKITKHVLGYNDKPGQSSFQFDMNLNYKLPTIINKYSCGEPTLIFCTTRQGIELASNVLRQKLSISFNNMQKSILCDLSNSVNDAKLKTLLPSGIAFHHGGLTASDRKLIEYNFRLSHIPVLLCTSTLAMGINLPAHLVIIKSTQNGLKDALDYPESVILQMIGRAGRPQFHESGTAIIMTQTQNVQKYIRLVSGTTPIESHLHKHLIEHLNSEIVLQTIYNSSASLTWLKSTFLYVRAHENPVYYGLPSGATKTEIDKKLEEMCLVAINSLEKHKIVVKEQAHPDELKISATAFGNLMWRYYVSFNSIKLFSEINGAETLPQILNILTQCQEFMDFPLRKSDKKILNNLNNSKFENIRYKIKGKIKTVSEKVSCLLQAILGCLAIDQASLNQEAFNMINIAKRLATCLYEYIVILNKTNKQHMFNALLSTTILLKCLEAKLWENSHYVSRQLEKIGPMYSNLLAKSGKTSLESIVNCNPSEIEKVLNKNPPFGSEIIEQVLKFPEYYIEMKITDDQIFNIKIIQINENYVYCEKDEAVLIIGDLDTNIVLYHNEKICSAIEESGCFEEDIHISPNVQRISTSLINKKIVGIDVQHLKTLRFENDRESSNSVTDKSNEIVKKHKTTSKLTDFFSISKKPIYDVPIEATTSKNGTSKNTLKMKQLTVDIPRVQPNYLISNSKRKLKNFEFLQPNKIKKLEKEPVVNNLNKKFTIEIIEPANTPRKIPINSSKCVEKIHVYEHVHPKGNTDQMLTVNLLNKVKHNSIISDEKHVLPFPIFFKDSFVGSNMFIDADLTFLWRNYLSESKQIQEKDGLSDELDIVNVTDNVIDLEIGNTEKKSVSSFRDKQMEVSVCNYEIVSPVSPDEYNYHDDFEIIQENGNPTDEAASPTRGLFDSSFSYDIALSPAKPKMGNGKTNTRVESGKVKNLFIPQGNIAKECFASQSVNEIIDLSDTFEVALTQNIEDTSDNNNFMSFDNKNVNSTSRDCINTSSLRCKVLNDTFDRAFDKYGSRNNTYFKSQSIVSKLDDTFDLFGTQVQKDLKKAMEDPEITSSTQPLNPNFNQKSSTPCTSTSNYFNWNDSFEVPSSPAANGKEITNKTDKSEERDLDIGIEEFLNSFFEDDNPFSDVQPSKTASPRKLENSWGNDSFSEDLESGNFFIDFDNLGNNIKKVNVSNNKKEISSNNTNTNAANKQFVFNKKNSSSAGEMRTGTNTMSFYETASKTFFNRANQQRNNEVSTINYDKFIRSKFLN